MTTGNLTGQTYAMGKLGLMASISNLVTFIKYKEDPRNFIKFIKYKEDPRKSKDKAKYKEI